MPTGEGSDAVRERRAKEEAARKRAAQQEARAKAITQQGKAEYNANQNALKEQMKARKAELAAQQQAAIDTYQNNAANLASQAQQSLANPVNVGNPSPDLGALQKITGVALNPALEGGNAAQSSFYVSPESTQSQYAVGAPVGGGNIGTRQRASTPGINPTTDKFGGGTKDQL